MLNGQSQNKRIAILGTSNSIMRGGWAKHFATIAPKTWDVVNFSLGGNCALFMPAQQELNAIAENFDLCIIELFVNDQRYIDSGVFRDDYFAATLAGLLAQFNRAPGRRCVPLILSLPKQNSYTPPKLFDSCGATVARLCNALQIPMLDGGEIVRAACEGAPRETEELFSDGLHLKPAVQRHISATLLRRLSADWPEMPPSRSPIYDVAPVFAAVAVDEFETDATIATRETSLAKWQVAKLAEGQIAVIKCPPQILKSRSAYCCGFLHWADPFADRITLEPTIDTRPSLRKSLIRIKTGALSLTHRVLRRLRIIRHINLPAQKNPVPVQKQLRKIWPGGLFFFTHLITPMRVETGVTVRSGADPWLTTEPSINGSTTPGNEPVVNELVYIVFCDRNPDIVGAEISRMISDQPVTCSAGFDATLARQLRVIPLDK